MCGGGRGAHGGGVMQRRRGQRRAGLTLAAAGRARRADGELSQLRGGHRGPAVDRMLEAADRMLEAAE